MKRVLKRIRQLMRNGPQGMIWLVYVLGVAPWAHRLSLPLMELQRRKLRWHHHHRALDERMARLNAKLAQASAPSAGIALQSLSADLERIVAPQRTGGAEVPLAEVDQDGFLVPIAGPLWNAPVMARECALPRRRYALTVVDVNGRVGVRKAFKGDRSGFLNEVEAALSLREAGCKVPAILAVDTEGLSVTYEYIRGRVVREMLATAGAQILDRQGGAGTASAKLKEALRVLPQVVDPRLRERIGEALVAIHRAGFALGDVKHGNIIVEHPSQDVYFVDFEDTLRIAGIFPSLSRYIRDRDSEKLNRQLLTELITAKGLRDPARWPGIAPLGPGPHGHRRTSVYAPAYVADGISWGAIWNTDVGIGRWRFIMADNLPLPLGGRVLDLGANNGFNALQMLREGVARVVAMDIDPGALRQGRFLHRVYEWADNRTYDIEFLQGSHQDIESLDLPRFDLVTAFCTLYYMDEQAMGAAVERISRMTNILVLQCNTDRLIHRADPTTFTKASIVFTVDLLKNHGFPAVNVVAPRGYSRPLVIGRKAA